ncbi:MAG TPA: MBL fold metallo-hydrolase [Jatrophihabitantaceae bacterium]|nr:MBL fold metallo-hydrolase [Jatrophihabitantaceae bacterium]
MQLTKFTHSCVRFDDADRTLVIDPGVFSEVDAALDGADALLITHEHPDHLDAERVTAALRANSRLRVWAPASVAGTLAEFGERITAVAAGLTFDGGGFEVRTFGGQHAVIHSSIPVVANVGYLIDGVFHPGDSLEVPDADVDTLLLPIQAPWSKVAEVIDFAVAVGAPRAYPIHDSMLMPAGRAIVEGHITRIGAEHSVEYAHLDPSQTVSV